MAKFSCNCHPSIKQTIRVSVESEYWVKISDVPLCMKSGNNLQPPQPASPSLCNAPQHCHRISPASFTKRQHFHRFFGKTGTNFQKESTSKYFFQVDCHRKGRDCAQVSIQPVHLMLAVIRVWKLLQVFLKICTFSHCCDAPPKMFLYQHQ